MDNLPQPVNQTTSALARVGLFMLIPVIGLLLFPLLLLFIIALHLLALVHGARVFVFHVRPSTDEFTPEPHRPHIFDIQAKPKELTDESTPPAKG